MGARFGEILADARKAKGITLRKLGSFVGLSPSFLSEIEHGKRRPPDDAKKIEHLALILGLEPDQLAQAVLREKARRNHPKVLEKFFDVDEDIAFGFCRAAEEATKDDLLKALEKALEVLGRGK
jgi:transcriptional regulator with XRE-family HTH domain